MGARDYQNESISSLLSMADNILNLMELKISRLEELNTILEIEARKMLFKQ